MQINNAEHAKKVTDVRLIVLDVDGVLSDGKITYSGDNSVESKSFNVKDGLGISLGIHLGLEFAIITARTSAIVKTRAADLGIQHVFQGIKNKRPTLLKLLDDLSIPSDQTVYMGDDLPDLPCMRSIGVSCCPADAAKTVLEEADIVSSLNGGEGAVREIIEYILENQGHHLSQINR